jgi:predicted acetyltransferase
MSHHGSVPAPAPELVNPISADEIPGWAAAMYTGFLSDPDGPERGRRNELLRRAWEPHRAWGARDHGRWVATLRTEPRLLSVPGEPTADVRVDALTNVAVVATHRRRGLMGTMLTASLRAARERGDAASILIAAEWPIYGRFGYAPATLAADYVLRRARPGSTAAGDPARVRHVDPGELGTLAPQIFETARRRRPGQIDRGAGWWDRFLGLDQYEASPQLPPHWIVHESDQGPDGFVGWSAGGSFGLIPPFKTLTVSDLTAAGDDAYRDLWAYLSGIDLAEELVLANRPVDEPARWLLGDARTLVMTQAVDFLWLRLLDVPGALAARSYAGHGELVLEVHDSDGDGFAAGRYLLRAGEDGAECVQTAATADLELGQRALASAYLGGFRLRELAISGAVVERTPGALRRADALFSTPLAPWNATWF